MASSETAEQEPDIRYVIVNTASVREKAEFGSQVIDQANFGQAFRVMEKRDSSADSVKWLKVESITSDLEGWISNKFIKKVSNKKDGAKVARDIDQLIDFTPSLEEAIPMIGKEKGEEENFDFTEYMYKNDIVTGFTILLSDSSKSELVDALGEPQLEQSGTLLYHGGNDDFIFKISDDGMIDTLTVVENEG